MSWFKAYSRAIILFVSFVVMVLLFAVSGAGLGIVQGIWEELPEIYAPDLDPAVTTRIYDRNGILIKTIGTTESRVEIVQISTLPSYVPQAFVAIEDERFYEHFGLDFKRIIGATLINLRRGRYAQGFSSITQQLVRNIYLHPEKTLTRKLKEMIMALRMEYRFTKDEILEMYLNTVFFGGNNHGIASASNDYFGKEPQELTIAEAAVLAGVLPAPNKYSPRFHPEKARIRQRAVLKKMLELGYLNQSQYNEALDIPIKTHHGVERIQYEEKAPYFTQEVVKDLVRILGKEKVYGGGLRVTTTLDLDMQRVAEDAFLSSSVFQTYPLSTYPDLQGAFVARSVSNGDVLALVGGRDFEVSQYNRATQARRQPGSCFKPFVWAAAFEQGIQPNLIINDAPVTYYIKTERREWAPENYGGIYHGPSLLRTALEHSYNIVAIKLLETVGIDPVIHLAKEAGIESPLKANLALALGASEVYPLELVTAYSCFSNEGIYTEPRFILKVEDSSGVLLYEAPHREREAMKSETAYKVFDMLKSVVENGSGRNARVEGLQIGGKTGTNQEFIDAWFVGVTPTVAAVATFGFNERISLGKKAIGSLVAAPVVGKFFRDASIRKPEYFIEQKFQKPVGVVSRYICRESGLLSGKNCPHVVLENFDKDKVPEVVCPIHNSESFLEPYLD